MKTTFLALLLALGLMPIIAVAQTDTTFTYQGELKENGNVVNGPFNIDFSLWDALSGGNQIGATVTYSGVSVVNGKFTVQLDFGASAFDNSDRWLEITVNTTDLTPRQPVTRTPYSIQTRGIVVDANKNVGIGTSTPLAELEVADFTAGDAAAVGVAADDAAGGLAAYSSTFVFPHLADRVSLFSDAFESSGLDLRADGPTSDIRFYSGGFDTSNERMRITKAGHVGIGVHPTTSKLHVNADGGYAALFMGGNVGIGTTQPGARLQVLTSSNTAVYASTSSAGYYGVRGRSESQDGTGVFGEGTGSGNSGGVYGLSYSPMGTGVYGNASSNTGVNYGVYGRSNSPDGFDFYAAGPGENYGSSSSRRWKSNVVEINQPLDKISKLRGVYFDWDQEHGGHHDVGMIAEEVGKVLPEIVQYEENGTDAIGMDYSKMTPLLVEAIKALRQEKDAEVSELKQQIIELRQLVHQLVSEKAAPEK